MLYTIITEITKTFNEMYFKPLKKIFEYGAKQRTSCLFDVRHDGFSYYIQPSSALGSVNGVHIKLFSQKKNVPKAGYVGDDLTN